MQQLHVHVVGGLGVRCGRVRGRRAQLLPSAVLPSRQLHQSVLQVLYRDCLVSTGPAAAAVATAKTDH